MSTIGLLLVAVLAAAFAVLALARPRLVLVMLVVLGVPNLNTVIDAHAGVSPYLAELGLAALALAVLARRGELRFAWSPVFTGVLVLYAAWWVSLATAVDPVVATGVLSERSKELVFFVLVIALALSVPQRGLVSGSAVTAVAALAALTAVHAFVLGGEGNLGGLSNVPIVREAGALTARHSGTSSDPNFWARLLVLFLPLSMSLAALAQGWRRLYWAGCALALLVGVYLTQSRGGFIAVAVAVVIWLALAAGRYRQSLIFLPLVGAVLVPLTGVASRLSTLGDVAASSTATADLSVVTRARLQLDALRMFLDSPLTGQGLGSFGTLFDRYDRLSNFYQPVDIVVAAHNFYLEQAADGGVVLLLGWAVFFGTVVFVALRARALTGHRSPAGMIALGVIGGVVGWLTASVFLHLSDFRAVLVVAAVAAEVDLRARRESAPPPLRELKPPSRRAVRVAAVVLAAVSAGSAVGFLAYPGRLYTSTTTLAILPSTPTVDGLTAYQLDLISRDLLSPSFARALQSRVTPATLGAAEAEPPPDVSLSLAPSRLGGAVSLTVSGADPDVVAGTAAAAAALSEQVVTQLRTPYALTGQPGPALAVASARRWLALPLALLSLVAGAVLLQSSSRRQQHREVHLDQARERFAPG